jgi:hypothetical protein
MYVLLMLIMKLKINYSLCFDLSSVWFLFTTLEVRVEEWGRWRMRKRRERRRGRQMRKENRKRDRKDYERNGQLR